MKRIVLHPSNPNNAYLKAYNAAAKKGAKTKQVLQGENGWVVKNLYSSNATRIFSTKAEAVQNARKMAKKQKTNLFIHGRDGSIQERISY